MTYKIKVIRLDFQICRQGLERQGPRKINFQVIASFTINVTAEQL